MTNSYETLFPHPVTILLQCSMEIGLPPHLLNPSLDIMIAKPTECIDQSELLIITQTQIESGTIKRGNVTKAILRRPIGLAEQQSI